MDKLRITPVILSGGSGTRLWPLSRAVRPKQMLALTGAATMLQSTAERVRGAETFAPPIVVTSAIHADLVERQLAEAGISPSTLILEPCPRNTAPAIALAALCARPTDILLVMPSDHVIQDPDAFRAAVEAALPLAEQGWLTTFGIAPVQPETGYGYIRRGEELATGVYAVERFVEKPDVETARRYLAEGCYDWNGGIFLFRADAYLAELGVFAPDILASARAGVEAGSRDGVRLRPEPVHFSSSPAESIDNAVMERSARIAVVPVDMGWSDVGSWDALHEIGAKDGSNNATAGDVLAIDTKGCLIHSDGPLVVAVGVEDLVIVSTKDAILIVPRGQSQRVREAVEALKAQAHPTLDG